MADGILTPCNVACGSGIVTVNSPSGSTLQCDTWLWDDMSLNSPKRPCILEFYIWFRFRPHHRSRQVILHQSPKFYPNRSDLDKVDQPGQKNMTSCRFSRWRISATLNFRGPLMGSLKSQCTTSYRSSIQTIALNCLVFEKSHLFAFWRQTDKQTDRPTDGHHRRTKPLSLS